MRIHIRDGQVVCSMEHKNRDFLSAAWAHLDGFDKNGNLKMYRYKTETMNEKYRIIYFYKTLDELIDIAKRFNIEIDSAVYDLHEQYRQAQEEIERREEEIKKYIDEKEKWELICKFGCGYCKHKIMTDPDRYICNAVREVLPIQNKPEFDGEVYRLFNFVAYPSENCPYKVEKREDDEQIREYAAKHLHIF